MPGVNRPMRFVDVELHPVEFVQKVVRKLDVGLVDFVDQDDSGIGTFEGLPQHAGLDVIADVRNFCVTELRIAQSRYGVVFVQALLRFGRGLDVPLEKRTLQRARHLEGKQRLAGTRLALDQKRPLERQRRIDRQHQVGRGDIAVGSLEAHSCPL